MLNIKHMFKSLLQINAFLLHPKHTLLIICRRNTSQNRTGTRLNASEYYSLVCFFCCVVVVFIFFIFCDWSLPLHVGDRSSYTRWRCRSQFKIGLVMCQLCRRLLL